VTGEDDFGAVGDEMFDGGDSSSDSGVNTFFPFSSAGDRSPALFLAADIITPLLLLLVLVVSFEEEEEERAWRSNEAAEAARMPRPREDRVTNRQHGRLLLPTTALVLLLLVVVAADVTPLLLLVIIGWLE